MALTANEQLFLELVNRARLDPRAEAARQGIDLNAGLSAGRITADAKQVLAPDPALERAAVAHSLWMLEADVFSHTGEGGSSAAMRITDAGYALTGTWRIGENLVWSGSSAAINVTAAAAQHHDQLYESAVHRVNLMDGAYRETGIAQELGLFTAQGADWNASMLTQMFALSAARQFVTGVVINDRDGDQFYDIGDGRAGATISGAGRSTATTDAGGYALAVGPAAAVALTLTLDGVSRQVWVDTRPGNIKLDLLSDGTLLTSGSMTLGTGATDAQLLGAAGRTLTGNALANELTGSTGNDLLIGGLGDDMLSGGLGNDTMWGGLGDDRVADAFGNNEVWAGAGNDTVIGGSGNEILGGGAGNDLVDARAGGRNQLWGGDGADTLWASANGDIAGGGTGKDLVWGGAGGDTLMGGLGDDTVHGESGNDAIYLAMGDDAGYGGAGNDTLFAGPGFDRMWGGTGSDRFECWRGQGHNRIEDFNPGEGDVIALGRGIWTGTHGPLTAQQVVTIFGRVDPNGDVILDFTGAGTSVVLVGAGSLAGLADDLLIL